MDSLILRLLPEGQFSQDIPLQIHRLESSILDTTQASSLHVFCDCKYQAKLVGGTQNIRYLHFLLNGNALEITFSPYDGMITFHDRSVSSKIFQECYGFIQITLVIEDDQGIQTVLDTPYIQVMVRKSRKNEAVKRMTEYVYRKNAEFLSGNKPLPKSPSGLKGVTNKTLEAKILLLKKISVVFEENYRYFKTNSRFKTIPKERIEHFEKLQYVSRNTMRFIAQHPEELQRVTHSSGIKIGSFRYQPNKTLITSNEKTYDIYENRVIVGFLATLVRELGKIEKELSGIVTKVPHKPMESGEYVSSSYFIYATTISSLRVILEDVKKLHQKFITLHGSYAEILPVSRQYISALPKLTPVFKSVPQYHQIYDCAVAWFTKGAFSLDEEKYMLSFLKISSLYEVYVLAKVIEFFKDSGYSMTVNAKITYPFSSQTLYENTTCNNYFVLKKGASTVTVYYQPVIYSTNKQTAGNIGLFRNNSISFPGHDGASRIDRAYGSEEKFIYTPDYLIKYEYEGQSGARYLIADAKFSTVNTVKVHQVAKLAYKYLFSLSSFTPEDSIVGLCIFNGQSYNEIDTITNVYDFAPPGRQICPRADILTLTENEENNLGLHSRLLRNTVGLFTSPESQQPIAIPMQEINPVELHSVAPQVEIPTKNAIPSPVSPPNPQDVKKAESPNFTSAPLPPAKSPLLSPINSSILSPPPVIPSTKLPRPALAKKSTKKAAQTSLSEMPLEVLLLSHDLEMILKAAGYHTVADLIPNNSKKDLNEIKQLNRHGRREVEAKIKQQRIRIS